MTKTNDMEPGPQANETPEHIVWLNIMGKSVSVVAVMGLGALYGITAYKLFDKLFALRGPGSGLMLSSFLAGVPLVIGGLVGFFSERRDVTGPRGASVTSMLSIGLCTFAAGAFLREGVICIVMALPFFLVIAGLGALFGWSISQRAKKRDTKILSIALFLPFIAAPLESQLRSSTQRIVTTREIQIAAASATIWKHINLPTNIDPQELKSGFAYRIGVPYPIEARTVDGRVGGKRELRWERGVAFQEKITDWQPERRIAWTYEFAPDSFPPGSFDDHIMIGGRYFNLVSTSYLLTPDSGGTRLTIEVETTVTTNFNWYAGWWAQYLVGNTAETILKFYKHRAEYERVD
jgi:uncharacterized protein YndB with AHSA1/START domain